MEIKEKTNENAPAKVVTKTTETLIKELETMSDTGLHDLFMFFYNLNCNHGNMIYNDMKTNRSFLFYSLELRICTGFFKAPDVKIFKDPLTNTYGI